ncbi:unnamed protein product [Calypogeia fissa]
MTGWRHGAEETRENFSSMRAEKRWGTNNQGRGNEGAQQGGIHGDPRARVPGKGGAARAVPGGQGQTGRGVRNYDAAAALRLQTPSPTSQSCHTLPGPRRPGAAALAC